MHIFYIINTVNEFSTAVTGYFLSYKDALLALDSCHDWYKSTSSGEIWQVDTGLDKSPMLIYKRV